MEQLYKKKLKKKFIRFNNRIAMKKRFNLICGDCLDAMKQLPDESIGLVFTSPPYNVGVDYEVYKDNLPFNEYLDWIENVFTESIRLLVAGGHLVIQIANTGRQPYTPLTDFISTRLFNKIQMRGEIIWDKQNMTSATAWGSWLSANKPSLRDSHEYILIFRKEGDRKGTSDMKADEFMENTKAIWKIPPETDSDHPAPFPIKLADRVISLYSFKEETVLDMFMGHGTTGLACMKRNRNFIGIELNKKYFTFAERRISAEANQIKLFFGE